MTYAKLKNNAIEFASLFKEEIINGNVNRSVKTEIEILAEGYKIFIPQEKPSITVYQDIKTHYIEDDYEIKEFHQIVKKSDEEIIVVNTAWWNQNFLQIQGENLSEKNLWVAKETTFNGETYKLLQNDLPLMVVGANFGFLPSLKLLDYPDMTEMLTEEYINSLEKEYTDAKVIEETISYLIYYNMNNREYARMEGI